MKNRCLCLLAMIVLTGLIIISSCDLNDNKPPYAPGSPVVARVAGDTLMYDLSWSCGDPDSDPLMYNIHFGITNSPPLITSQPANRFRTSSLLFGTTYYWKIDALDNNHNQTSSPIWQFTTPTE
ncbi:MAG TPA: hypothetical protein DCZ43_10060 [candidate division Zixibacteria bacterium]|nr:hypothetical protein [candidate division Zixibacteria bacterium]